MLTEASTDDSFRALRRALVRRRFAQVDTRLRVELLALAAVVAAFVYWQVRVPLDGLARREGALAVARVLLGAWGLLSLSAGVLAGFRHATQLGAGAPGPSWRSLPVEGTAVLDHLAWESRTRIWWVAPAALGLLIAALGLVPSLWLPVLAALYWGMLVLAGRLACSIATRVTLWRTAPRPGVEAVDRLLARAARRPGQAPRRGRTRWIAEPAWRALWRKDLLITRRPTAARRRIVVPIAFGALSVIAWWTLQPLELARFAAFALVLMSAGSFGEWIIALGGEDPFSVLRALPVGVSEVWGARMASAMVVSLVLVTAHALAARSLPPPALQLFLVWLGAASLLIQTLAAGYGVTLSPRADVAQRLFMLALGVAMASSLMIPLLGWAVLLAVVLHSLRRLPRWAWIEDGR